MPPTVADVTVTAFVEVLDWLPNATAPSKLDLDPTPIAILASPLANAEDPCANDARPLAFDP